MTRDGQQTQHTDINVGNGSGASLAKVLPIILALVGGVGTGVAGHAAAAPTPQSSASREEIQDLRRTQGALEVRLTAVERQASDAAVGAVDEDRRPARRAASAPVSDELEQPPQLPLSWAELEQLALAYPTPPASALAELYASVPRYTARPSTWQRDPELTITTPRK